MAEDPNPMNEVAMTLLFRRIGLSDAASQFLTTDQGISKLVTLARLNETEVVMLCKITRKPGGQIEVAIPADGRRNATTHMVSNPGIPVAMLQEKNLRLAHFFLKYKKMTSRIITYDEVNIPSIEAFEDYKDTIADMIEATKEIPDIDKIPNLTHERIFEWFDEFREFLRPRIGKRSGRPLSYVVRKDLEVKNDSLDPAFGEDGSAYNTHGEEVEARAPIKRYDEGGTITTEDDRYFKSDNAEVWEFLWLRFKNGKYQAYIKPFLNKRDGRAAFTTLHHQLLGEQAIGNYAAAAELKLQTLNLNGTKTKNWNFERYLVEHKEQHMILEKLKDYGHAGISELSKVSYFKRGITDPALEHVKGSLACQKGTTTFDDVVTAYRTYKQSFTSEKGTTRSINVSAISASTGNRTSDRENKIGEKEDGYDQSKDYSNYHVKPRFYKTGEWNSLKRGERNYLRTVSRNKSNKSYANKDGNRDENKLKRKNKHLIAKVASL